MSKFKHQNPLPQKLFGFTYLGLLLVLVGITYITTLSVQAGLTMHRTEAERQLWSVGTAYEKAIIDYTRQQAPPGATVGAPSRPRLHQLEHLLKDPRTPGLQRHLRKLYADPMTGSMEWGIIRDANGAILGVYSTDKRAPIKKTGFDPQHADFESAKSYSQWIFGLPQARQMIVNN